eukprot:CAMPEP_0114999294 /NCGR_PEP_ID=MMETSP0216-20121206/16060_1 /TAXON_ID=223996 /ORGANISM="Protocruzia adherens, Strain Boccale" /LENGTH=153 /DNA_ID=CAMNT_0002364141 /DNA_START=329 /DNA_END=790 /DNA_ORIENTATION=-
MDLDGAAKIKAFAQTMEAERKLWEDKEWRQNFLKTNGATTLVDLLKHKSDSQLEVKSSCEDSLSINSLEETKSEDREKKGNLTGIKREAPTSLERDQKKVKRESQRPEGDVNVQLSKLRLRETQTTKNTRDRSKSKGKSSQKRSNSSKKSKRK